MDFWIRRKVIWFGCKVVWIGCKYGLGAGILDIFCSTDEEKVDCLGETPMAVIMHTIAENPHNCTHTLSQGRSWRPWSRRWSRQGHQQRCSYSSWTVDWMKKLRYFESKHNSYSEKTSEQTDEADRRDEAEVKRYPNRVKYYDKQLLSASKKDPLTKSLCGRIVWVL